MEEKHEIVTAISIPAAAQQLIMQMIAERDAAQMTLDRAAAVLLAGLGAPNGWQLQINQGTMIIAPPRQ